MSKTMTNDAAAGLPAGDRAWLARLTRELTSDAAAADELYHDVAVAGATAPADGILARRPWLRGVARRQAARRARDAARRSRHEQRAARDEALPSTLDEVERREVAARVAAAVRALTEPYRTAVRLRFFEDLKPAAIARRTGAPVETVRVRVRRGLAQLRARLDADFGSRAAWVAALDRLDAAEAGAAIAGAGFAPWVAGLAVGGALAFVAVTAVRHDSEPAGSGGPGAAPAASGVAFRGAEPPREPAQPRVALRQAAVAAMPARVEVADAAPPAAVVDDERGIAVLEVIEEIARVQRRFATEVRIDADGDGIGEHGYLLELVGAVQRSEARPPSQALAQAARQLRVRLGGRVARPAQMLGGLEGGVAVCADYAYQMFLPGADGVPLPEAPDGGPGPVPPDPDGAERAWCCYAWPLTDGYGTPSPVFFVDQAGTVLVADNARGVYVGVDRSPAPDAARRADAAGALGDASAASHPDGRGRDGQVWRRATLPPVSRTAVEVVDAAGEPVSGVLVAIVAPDEFPGSWSAAVREQRTALGRAALPTGARSEPTGADGRTAVEGRTRTAEMVVMVEYERMNLVPTRVQVADGRLRIEMPPAPDLRAARANANESAAIATLKNISSAQAQCQASGVIDANGNGAGEYGYFAELAGAAFVRGPNGPSAMKITPPVLSSAFGATRPASDGVRANIVVRSGYCFQIHLPDASYHGVPEDPAGGAGVVAPDPARSEVIWCCYAWPLAGGESGTRAFFVNQSGDVYASDNQRTGYTGLHGGPRFDAVFPADGDGTLGQALDGRVIGTDGSSWVVVN